MTISNSTTLNDLIGSIVSSNAQSAAYAARVMRPLVRTEAVPPGFGSITVPRFQSVAVAALTEGVAPSSTTLSTDGVTLTPVERGVFVEISKRALHADPFQDLAPYGNQMGRAMAQDEDSLLLTELASVTTNHVNVNSTGGTDVVTKADFLSAISKLEQANAPGPYYGVFHPISWARLRSAFADASVYDAVGRQQVNGFGAGFTNANGYVGSPFGVPCFISTKVPAITDDASATPSDRRGNVLFSPEAIGCAYIQDIGVDVDDNIPGRKFDLMGWYSVHCDTLVDSYAVVLGDDLT